MNQKITFESLLDSANLYEDLSAEVKRRIASGTNRETLLEQLSALRPIARKRGGDDLENTVLDIMDQVTGWCAPGAKL